VGVGLFINFQPYLSWPRIIVFLIIVGIGFGPNFHAPLIALQSKLQPRDVAAGTATFGFIRMLSGAIGLVLGQVIFQGRMQTQSRSLLDAGIPRDVVASLGRGSAISSTTGFNGLTSAQDYMIRQIKTEAFSRMWILYTVMSFLGLLASMGITKQVMTTTHEEVKTGISLPTIHESDSEDQEKESPQLKQMGVAV
jgi:hypothetical protein